MWQTYFAVVSLAMMVAACGFVVGAIQAFRRALVQQLFVNHCLDKRVKKLEAAGTERTPDIPV